MNENRMEIQRTDRWTQLRLEISEWEAGSEESFGNAIRKKEMDRIAGLDIFKFHPDGTAFKRIEGRKFLS